MSNKKILLLKLLGAALSFIGVVFLCLSIDLTHLGSDIQLVGVAPVIGFSLLYALSLTALSFAWFILLKTPNHDGLSFRAINHVYAKSVLTKYIPSGIFQYLSRQVDVVALGISQKTVARASLGEVLFQICAALLVIGICFLLSSYRAPELLMSYIPFLQDNDGVMPYLLIAFMVTGFFFTLKICNFKPHIFYIALYICFFAVMALMTGGLASYIVSDVSILTLGGALVLSWLIGFVVIGSSGGIGVREASILILLSPYCDAQSCASIALLLRMITTLGDVAFYMMIMVLGKSKKSS